MGRTLPAICLVLAAAVLVLSTEGARPGSPRRTASRGGGMSSSAWSAGGNGYGMGDMAAGRATEYGTASNRMGLGGVPGVMPMNRPYGGYGMSSGGRLSSGGYGMSSGGRLSSGGYGMSSEGMSSGGFEMSSGGMSSGGYGVSSESGMSFGMRSGTTSTNNGMGLDGSYAGNTMPRGGSRASAGGSSTVTSAGTSGGAAAGGAARTGTFVGSGMGFTK